MPPQDEGDFSTVLLTVLAAVLLAGAAGLAVYAKRLSPGGNCSSISNLNANGRSRINKR